MPSWSPSTPSSSLALGPDDEDSRLLSESLPSSDPFDASSRMHTGPGIADLSLSELSLADKPYNRDGPRFSLLAPPPAPVHALSSNQSVIAEDEEYVQDENEDADNSANDTMIGRVVAEKAREEKLQRDLFILKKLNASFALLNNALAATKSATEQVAEQLSQTDALLDKYANMLAKSEGVTRLIFDERWEGAEADEEILTRERQEALERARLEREREEAARREAMERAQAAEEAARREAEERAQQEATAMATSRSTSRGRGTGVSASSGVRGVRGTRATAMAARGGRVIPRAAAPPSSSAIPRVRSASATGSVGSTTGGTRPSSSASRGTGVPRGVLRKG